MSTEEFIRIVTWKVNLKVMDKKQDARVPKLEVSSLTALLYRIQSVVNVEFRGKKTSYNFIKRSHLYLPVHWQRNLYSVSTATSSSLLVFSWSMPFSSEERNNKQVTSYIHVHTAKM